MLPGVKETNIFGFCDIRNFTDATEVLEDGDDGFIKVSGKFIASVAAAAAPVEVSNRFVPPSTFQEQSDDEE